MLSDVNLRRLEALEKNKDFTNVLNPRESELLVRLIRSYREVKQQYYGGQVNQARPA
ncbi:MAG TPA: hypothetical protein VLH61_06150 [Bacteroidales bacterium]|nr:hypothetical protein [Bacteroidales bacterium]